MSVPPECDALPTSTISLYRHASAQLALFPGGALPHGGRPYPDEAGQRARPADGLTHDERRQIARNAIAEFFDDPALSPRDLHDRLLNSSVTARSIMTLVDRGLTAPPEKARSIGLWLATHATDRRPALIGLALLKSVAQREDILVIRTLGALNRLFGSTAVAVLRGLAATDDLIWLAERSDAYYRSLAVEAICALDDPAARGWLMRHALHPDEVRSSVHARAVAEHLHLPAVLRATALDPQVVVHTGRLILAMSTPSWEKSEIRRYGDATVTLSLLGERLAVLPPSPDHAALLLRLAEDLHTGHAGTLPWPSGERTRLAAQFVAPLGLPHWQQVLAPSAGPPAAASWRAHWARQATGRIHTMRPTDPPHGDHPRSTIAVHVVVPDPASSDGDVETRVLVDGRPIIAEAFDRGAPGSPEHLLDGDTPLRATAAPHEVQLAEAWCTEGCCGALYVTIERDADAVVWHRWRTATPRDEPLPSLRFDAARYDEEIARAERDHGWEWPARTAARLLRRRLQAEPELLGRWGCHLARVFARHPFLPPGASQAAVSGGPAQTGATRASTRSGAKMPSASSSASPMSPERLSRRVATICRLRVASGNDRR